MGALAKAPPGDASDLGLTLIDCDDLDVGTIEQQIEFAPTGFALAVFDHDGSFQ
jgi:hypothetical protein